MKGAGYLRENYHYFHLRDTAGQELDFHFHEFDKLVILLSGRVEYSLEGVTYSMEPWDVLPVKHHVIHKALIDRSLPYERVIIYLDRKFFDRILPEAALMESFDRSRGLLSPDEQQRRELKNALEAYENSEKDGRRGAQTMRDTLMIQLLIVVNRLTAAGEIAEPGSDDPKIGAILSYINENLHEELSVDALAERAYLSRYHFMRLFKQHTGCTVHEYVRQRRLLNAARLIREGTGAALAAEQSGFKDYSAFHRAFKTAFGISPGSLK